MKYFICREAKKNRLPEIGFWFGTLGPQSNTAKFHSTSKWILLDADIKEDALYADLLSSPCILMTEKMFQVLHMYQEHLLKKSVVLLDKKRGTSFHYLLTNIPCHSVLREDSKLDQIKSEIILGIIDRELVNKIPFFLIGEVSKPTLVFREDVAESLIRRAVKGFELQEIELQ